ncbi:MAG: hypothetical protein R2824_17940 [Saprospiraceae bacterium]
MKRPRHLFPAVVRLFLYVVIGCLSVFPQLLSGNSLTDYSNNKYTAASLGHATARIGDFALTVTAKTVESTVCSNNASTEISYAIAGGPEVPDQYAIEADAAAKTAGFADVTWTALPGPPYPMHYPS